MTQTALLVIDLQNDYFADGRFPLWDSDKVLRQTKTAIQNARKANMNVILVQHQDSANGPFFTPNSHGVQIHSEILATAGNVPIITKTQADSFLNTDLSTLLKELNINKLIICGMMSHNCVTHTALSNAAQAFELAVLADCTTTVSEILHQIALNALAPRVNIINSANAF